MATNSFFYGETPSPEANTVDQLIDSLNEKLQEAEGAKDSAETAATSAATSAANAATSQSAAFTASQQAVTSAISATNAANSSSASATASLASSLAAATSEGNASISADNAASSESAALASQVATAALYDQFDDRYLGSKATDPTLDNDGNALTDGALYFDTTLNVMKVYDLGTTAWVRTIPTTSDQANINTVTTNVADVTTVAGSIANVNTTAGSIANVNTTASNIANVNTVAGISANVTTVATNNANVTTVASNIGNVNTVGGISANVTTVAGISSDVTTVASNITDVQNAEENADAAILAASQAATSASNASTSASQASGFAVQSSNSATASATSATAAANSATASAASASAASDSAETAAAATNAVLWVSGTTYAIGFLVYSPLDNRVYRRLTAGAGTTDPSADATNWVQLTRVVEQSDIGTAPNEVPLNQYLGALAYVDTEYPQVDIGTGITSGTGTICKANAGSVGGVYKMTVLIDLTGLNSGGTAGDIIGVDGTALPCYIARLPTMTVLGGRMTCLEAPAGGDDDIDLYSAAEGTGVEDGAITALTETQIINGGTQSAGTVTYFAADPSANHYFYLVGQSTSNATYTAGRFLIEVFGV
jgi:hypothetical protein